MIFQSPPTGQWPRNQQDALSHQPGPNAFQSPPTGQWPRNIYDPAVTGTNRPLSVPSNGAMASQPCKGVKEKRREYWTFSPLQRGNGLATPSAVSSSPDGSASFSPLQRGNGLATISIGLISLFDRIFQSPPTGQ